MDVQRAKWRDRLIIIVVSTKLRQGAMQQSDKKIDIHTAWQRHNEEPPRGAGLDKICYCCLLSAAPTLQKGKFSSVRRSALRQSTTSFNGSKSFLVSELDLPLVRVIVVLSG
jgi:hypothetical protein